MRTFATGRVFGVKPSQMFSMRVVSDFIPDRSRPGKQRRLPLTGHQEPLVDMLLGCKEEVESSGEERRREMERGKKLEKSS